MVTRRASAYSRPFLYVVGWTSERSCWNHGASMAGGATLPGGAGSAPPGAGGGGRLGGSEDSGVDTSGDQRPRPVRRAGGSVLLPREAHGPFPHASAISLKRLVVKGETLRRPAEESPRSYGE